MTLGEKLKEIRKKFGLSQEQLAELMNVSRQAITKWENDTGIPETSNLQILAQTFGITIDYLLSNENELPLLVMRKQLNRDKYSTNKIKSYTEVLKQHYPEPWEVYGLMREKKMSKLEGIFDFFIGAGTVELADSLNDMSPYYLVKKDNLKMIVNIKDWVLEVQELPTNIDEKKFTIGKNKFVKIKKKIDLK